MHVKVLKEQIVIINVKFQLEIAMIFVLHVLNLTLNMDAVHAMNRNLLENNILQKILLV